jgi:peptide/nickel transport system substrate-binding protein
MYPLVLPAGVAAAWKPLVGAAGSGAVELRETAESESASRSSLPGAFAIDRRRLLGGVAAAVPLAAVAPRLAEAVRAAGSSRGVDRPQLRQDGTGIDATPPAGTAATPAPGATPAPTAPLRIVTDQRPTYDGDPVAGGTLRLLLARPIVADFNPVAARQDVQVACSYLDPLLWADEVTMEPRPWLAERWEWSEDGTEITYVLRDDVTWHDGTPLTAEDVRFSLYVYRDDLNSAVRNFFAGMREAEVLDERRLRVALSEPDGGWLFNASTQLIFQREQYRTHWSNQAQGNRSLSGFDWDSTPPVGTGPWVLDDVRERRLIFTRNEEYWAGPPHFEELAVSVYENPAARLQRWLAGEADLLWLSGPDEIAAAEGSGGTLYVADAAEVMFAAFNFANPTREGSLFADNRVRLALSAALDRARYADQVFGGYFQADRAGTIAQPWANDPALVNPTPNPIAARQLLTNAGWLDRDADRRLEEATGTPLSLVAILRDDGRPELAATLRLVADDLRALGIDLEVQALDPTTFRRRWSVERDYDLIAFAYALYPGFTDFDLFGSDWDIRTNPQGFNPGGYANPAADEAIARARAATEIGEQREALRDLQRAVNDDLFALWFGFPRDLILARPDVLGFQPNKVWQTWDTRKLWRAG